MPLEIRFIYLSRAQTKLNASDLELLWDPEEEEKEPLR